jgi:hypothetical protein
MSSGPRFFLTEDGRRTGPHSLAVLKQKAELGVIKPDSALAPEAEPEAWEPIRDSSVLNEELFPARPRFNLAHRAVERVNTPGEPRHVPSVDEMLRANLARQQAAEGELLKPMPPRSNRRRNDYLILAAMINGLFVVNLIIGRPWYDPFLIGLFVMGNVSLAWVLFGVMDRY